VVIRGVIRGQSENLGILSQGRLEEEIFTAEELFCTMIRERVIGKAEHTPQRNNFRNASRESGNSVFTKR
jgi:hypothetical protein